MRNMKLTDLLMVKWDLLTLCAQPAPLLLAPVHPEILARAGLSHLEYMNILLEPRNTCEDGRWHSISVSRH